MKRSEINAVIRKFEALLSKYSFALPPKKNKDKQKSSSCVFQQDDDFCSLSQINFLPTAGSTPEKTPGRIFSGEGYVPLGPRSSAHCPLQRRPRPRRFP